MPRPRLWPVARSAARKLKAVRSRERARKVFLGPEIVLSGDITSCDTLIAAGIIVSNRVECRKFVLSNTGSFKGSVQAESAIVNGRFEGQLQVRAGLLIRSRGRVRGSVHYGQIEIEPGGELQGDMAVVHPEREHPEEELDMLDIAVGQKPGFSIAKWVSSTHKLRLAVPGGEKNRTIEVTPEKRELAHQ